MLERQLVSDGSIDSAALIQHCENHIARYKLPKVVKFVNEVLRSPAGKPDYRWATAVAIEGNT